MVGFPAITSYEGLDQLQTQVRRLMPECSAASNFPEILSRQMRAGQSGEGRCLPVQSTPLDVVTKSLSPTTRTELLAWFLGKAPTSSRMSNRQRMSASVTLCGIGGLSGPAVYWASSVNGPRFFPSACPCTSRQTTSQRLVTA